MRRACSLPFLLFALAPLGRAADVYLPGLPLMPTYTQTNDYKDLIKGLVSDIKTQADANVPNRDLRYRELPDFFAKDLIPPPKAPIPTRDLYLSTKNFVWKPYDLAFEPANNRRFVGDDLDDIYNGRFHCSPTAAAMLLQFNALKYSLPQLGIAGRTETAFINDVSVFMDTNDINPAKNKDAQGILGTYVRDVAPGINDYAVGKVGPTAKAKITYTKFDWAAYLAEIANNRSVLINARLKEGAMFHTVVGIGYREGMGDDRRLIVRDPADGLDATCKIPTAIGQIGQIADGLSGVRFNTQGDVAITEFNDFEPLQDATMITFDIEPVPEPGTWVALGLGAVGLLRRRKRA